MNWLIVCLPHSLTQNHAHAAINFFLYSEYAIFSLSIKSWNNFQSSKKWVEKMEGNNRIDMYLTTFTQTKNIYQWSFIPIEM